MDKIVLNERHINVAVSVVVFNRLDCVQKLLDAVRKAQPPRLYVISDGPRENVCGEYDKVQAVRNYIEQNVDWNCEVIKVYSDENMGCDNRSVTGMDYVMKHEEKIIYFEDDCIPLPEFFSFCEDMLEIYSDCKEVMMIAGMTAVRNWEDTERQYFFTHFALKCGWATWRRAWDLFDVDMKSYKNFSDKYLYEIMPESAATYFKGNFLSNYNGNIVWDSKWDYTVIYNRGFCVVPRKTLVTNIGFDREDSTHTKGSNPLPNADIDDIDRVMTVRKNITWDKDYDWEQTGLLFKGSKRFFYREKVLYFAKKYFPKPLYNSISFIKRKILHLQ